MRNKWTPEQLIFTGHALRQMFARRIGPGAVREVIKHGEMLADYPDDHPHPSRLLLGFVNEQPIHVVLGYNEEQRTGYVVTAYTPDPDLWHPDFKHRREP